MKEPLSYGTRLDWGNKTLPPKYIKMYGLAVLVLMCGYLWKFHEHHASLIFQAIVAALAITVAIMLASRWTKNDKINQFLFWFLLAQTIVQAIALLHSW